MRSGALDTMWLLRQTPQRLPTSEPQGLGSILMVMATVVVVVTAGVRPKTIWGTKSRPSMVYRSVGTPISTGMSRSTSTFTVLMARSTTSFVILCPDEQLPMDDLSYLHPQV